MPEPLITLITTLAGAFSGALAAFFLQEHRESRNKEEQNVAAINRAIYTIYNLWSIQHQYQVEVIEPYRGKSDAWLNMSATPPSHYGLTSFDAEALSFLLKTHAQTYAELMLEENRFQAAMDLIRLRSSTALNEAWPRLATANVALGAKNDEKREFAALSVSIFAKNWKNLLKESLNTLMKMTNHFEIWVTSSVTLLWRFIQREKSFGLISMHRHNKSLKPTP